jgi:hypothetical protein
MAVPEPRIPVSVPLALLMAWAVPGLAHFFLAERLRGLCVGLGVGGLFVLGVLIGGVRIVEAPRLDATRPVASVLSSPTFLGQSMVGPLAFVAAYASKVAATHPETARIRSHARVNEIGTLYTTVAGLLNVLAMLDVWARASARRSAASTPTGAT